LGSTAESAFDSPVTNPWERSMWPLRPNARILEPPPLVESLNQAVLAWRSPRKVVHTSGTRHFHRSPECPYLLGFLHRTGPWKRVPPSPPSFLDSAEVLQNQAFLEPPENDGGAPRWSTAGRLFWHRRTSIAIEIRRSFESVAELDAGYASSRRRPLSARLGRCSVCTARRGPERTGRFLSTSESEGFDQRVIPGLLAIRSITDPGQML
jgi:hypothetical protein